MIKYIQGTKGRVTIEWLYEQTKDAPRGTLKNICDKNGLDFNNTKQAIYRYRKSLPKPQPRKPKKKKAKILTMNDIYKWLEENPNDVITIRMTQNRKNSIRTVWKDQYSKFADFLSIVNLIK